MKTFTDILACWETLGACAKDIGASEHTVRKWKQRDSIPPEWWPNLIIGSKRVLSRKDRLTADKLMQIAAHRRPPKEAD